MTADRHRLSAPKWLVILLLAALAPAVARADQSTERAKQLFQEGTTLFNVGEFDKAIEAWQEGYKEKPDPGFLYNIGQAYRLKGDNQKAIFFYRGYLRNSPRALNKAEVEAKIAQLQKAAEGKPVAPPPTPSPAPVAPTPAVAPAAPTPAPVKPAPVAPAPAPVAPPPVDPPPLAGSSSSPPPVAELPAAEPARPQPNRPLDFGLGLGFDAWTSGVRAQKVQPSFALNLGAGYSIGDVFGKASFRLGALLSLTTLKDVPGDVKFTSLLAEPGVRVRLVQQRLYLPGALGIGALFISGMKSGSTLLTPPMAGQSYVVPSTISLFELRPAVGLQLHLTQAIVASVTPALSIAPKKDRFYQNVGRFELLFGLSIFL
jgi:hypothetical protein